MRHAKPTTLTETDWTIEEGMLLNGLTAYNARGEEFYATSLHVVSYGNWVLDIKR